MNTEVIMETVDLKIKKDGKIELCKGEIAGNASFLPYCFKGRKNRI